MSVWVRVKRGSIIARVYSIGIPFLVVLSLLALAIAFITRCEPVHRDFQEDAGRPTSGEVEDENDPGGNERLR